MNEYTLVSDYQTYHITPIYCILLHFKMKKLQKLHVTTFKFVRRHLIEVWWR